MSTCCKVYRAIATGTIVLTLLTTALTAGCAPQIKTVEVEVTTTPASATEPSVAPISLVDSGQRLGAARSWDVSLGDLDGDGDLDAFMAGSPNQVWLNDSAGTFTDSGQELSSRAGDSVALGDLDGDGDIDAFLAVSDWSGSDDKVWLNEGGGCFTDSGLPLSADFSSGIGLGDLDGDGDLDAFVVHGELGRDSGGGIPNEVWLNETP